MDIAELIKRAQHIQMIVFDVDGVLTGGQIIFGQSGEVMKVFHVQDGLGISAAHRVGLKTAIITGRQSDIVRLRSAELQVTHVYQGVANKLEGLQDLLTRYQLRVHQVAYVGDDLNDLPIMSQVGLSCAVANAAAEVKECAHYVAQKQGGQGAVREIIEMILKAQGKWEDIVQHYKNAHLANITQ
ncbi:MAG: HAD-IIIA family hydrolase [Pelosinus sp.]|nr:HAD-IIIA family hydrolase [Pelosinus sp.]